MLVLQLQNFIHRKLKTVSVYFILMKINFPYCTVSVTLLQVVVSLFLKIFAQT
jgi:hypothetical protein